MPLKQKLLVFLATLLVRFLRLTCRYKLVFASPQAREQFAKVFHQKDGQALVGFFHQDELCLLPYFIHKNFAVLVSLSRDGSIMSGLVQNLGFEVVRGSSSKGAARGLLAAIKKTREGYNFAIAVDGPRGPIYKVKEGLPAIARKTGIPIFPIRGYPSRAKIFEKSWNKAKLPLPFSTIEVRVGEPGVFEAAQLEEALNRL